MSEKSNNRTIAKNTIFLYVRMLIIMVVTLYTSRVILQVLGVDNFGLYQAVGGVVGFLAFINGALSTATSRFITFALGKGDKTELKNTFATTLTSHIIIGLLVALIAETIGLWYVCNKMVIPEERFSVALIVYHISILTAFITIVQVPYYAEVIAHERMTLFAYVGIVEAIAKLGIVYLLLVGNIDKLVLYATLLLLVSVGIFVFYVIYCRRFFAESGFKLMFDKKLFGQVFSFSGWSLFANGAIALSNQGILLLLNLFFAPAVVTARSISLQVNSVANQFVQNFRTAANPQIVKRYGAGDLSGSKSLLLESTKFSYYLMLLISLPLFLLADPLLHLWLVEVPEYTVIFLQIVIVQSLFQVFDTSFYTALYAKGRIKENAMLSPLVVFLCFPVVYILFKMGYPPVALSWAYLVGYAILGMIIKPLLLHKIVDYSWKELLKVYWVCFIVTIMAFPVPLFLYYKMDKSYLTNDIIIFIVSLITVTISVWTLGLTQNMRRSFFETVKNRYSFRRD